MLQFSLLCFHWHFAFCSFLLSNMHMPFIAFLCLHIFQLFCFCFFCVCFFGFVRSTHAEYQCRNCMLNINKTKRMRCIGIVVVRVQSARITNIRSSNNFPKTAMHWTKWNKDPRKSHKNEKRIHLCLLAQIYTRLDTHTNTHTSTFTHTHRRTRLLYSVYTTHTHSPSLHSK